MATSEYQKKDWTTGETITEDALDNMEGGISAAVEGVRKLEEQVSEGRLLVSIKADMSEDGSAVVIAEPGLLEAKIEEARAKCNQQGFVQGASYRLSSETFSASKSDCSVEVVSPGQEILPVIVGDLIEDATGAVWQVAAVADGTFTVGAAPVRLRRLDN